MKETTYHCISKLFAKITTRKLIAAGLTSVIIFAVAFSAKSLSKTYNNVNVSAHVVSGDTSTALENSEEILEYVTVNDIPVRLGSFDVIPHYGEMSIVQTTTNNVKQEETKSEVSYEYVTVTKTIKFKTIEQKTDELDVGVTKVKQKGSDGTKEVTYLKEVVNGETVASEYKSEKIIKEAVDKIVLVGTRYKSNDAVQTSNDVKSVSTLTPSKPIELDANGVPCNYKKVMKGKATAYASGKVCSTGVKVQPGYIAVNPNIIPYGTKMYIVSDDGKYTYGYAVAADTGGFIKSGRILADLYFPTESQCVNFGVRNITIYVLE